MDWTESHSSSVFGTLESGVNSRLELNPVELCISLTSSSITATHFKRLAHFLDHSRDASAVKGHYSLPTLLPHTRSAQQRKKRGCLQQAASLGAKNTFSLSLSV